MDILIIYYNEDDYVVDILPESEKTECNYAYCYKLDLNDSFLKETEKE